MKISVSLTTYFGEKFLNQQLNSILDQTRLPDELIVCDDGSNDMTLNLLDSFKKKASFKCEIYHNKVNRGTGFSFKKAIDLCSGDIILFCDQDDIWLPNKIEIIENYFHKNPHVDYVVSNASIIDSNSNYLGYTLWDQKKFTKKWKIKFNKNQFKTLFKKNIITGMSTAVSKKVVDLGQTKPNLVNHDAWYIYLASLSGLKGLLIDHPLTLYRQHDNQQFGSRKLTKYQNFRRLLKSNNNSIQLKLLNLNALLKYVNENSNKVSLSDIKYIKSVFNHYNFRSQIINANFQKRFFMILKEALKLNYKKYSNQKNILIDFLYNL